MTKQVAFVVGAKKILDPIYQKEVHSMQNVGGSTTVTTDERHAEEPPVAGPGL